MLPSMPKSDRSHLTTSERKFKEHRKDKSVGLIKAHLGDTGSVELKRHPRQTNNSFLQASVRED